MYAGINGAFSGKVGTVNGYLWNGIPVMRANPKKRTGPLSDKQLQQHAKFALMTKFLKPLVSFTNQTFETESIRVTGFNKAYSYNVKNAIAGIHTEPQIDYKMVKVGRGDLPGAQMPFVKSFVAGELTVTWTDNSGSGLARDTDQLFVAVFNEELNDWTCHLSLASRAATTASLQAPKFINKIMHVYLGFLSANGKNTSDSQYLGEVAEILTNIK